jgi:hypothetical protein
LWVSQNSLWLDASAKQRGLLIDPMENGTPVPPRSWGNANMSGTNAAYPSGSASFDAG